MSDEILQTFQAIELDAKDGMTIRDAERKHGKSKNWYYNTKARLKGKKKKVVKAKAKTTHTQVRTRIKRPVVKMIDLPQVPAPVMTSRLLVFTGSSSELLNIARSLS